MAFAVRVYHDQRDVTPWVQSLTVEQPERELYLQWTVELAAWSEITPGATWDIYGSYTPATDPRAVSIGRAGVLPPDRELRLTVASLDVPTLTLVCYDRVWLAQRRGPTQTLVLIPGSDCGRVREALEDYDGAVGSYRVLSNVSTMHRAVTRLLAMAGLRVRLAVPDYALRPMVVNPTQSYLAAALELLTPFRPDYWVDRWSNTLVFADPLAPAYNLRRRLTVPADDLVSVSGTPVEFLRARRVLLRVR